MTRSKFLILAVLLFCAVSGLEAQGTPPPTPPTRPNLTDTKPPVVTATTIFAVAQVNGVPTFLRITLDPSLVIVSTGTNAGALKVAQPAPAGTPVQDLFTASTAEQPFTLSAVPAQQTSPGCGIAIWKNGVKQRSGPDYALSGQALTFTAFSAGGQGITPGDYVEVTYCK